jgi:acetoacetate decarboxylase
MLTYLVVENVCTRMSKCRSHFILKIELEESFSKYEYEMMNDDTGTGIYEYDYDQ